MTGTARWDFSNRVVIVTGAAQGIGRGAAEAFARSAAEVCVLDVDRAGVEAAARELRSGGHKATAFHCNVAVEAEIEATVANIIEGFDRIDVLFNNAGINRRKGLMEFTADDWNAIISVNLIGSLVMARAVGRQMIRQRSGSIVNMSALGGGLVGLGRGTAIYTATKGAVAAMTRDLAGEWAPHGVRVNAVAPGWIETEINAVLLGRPDVVAAVNKRVPLSRWGSVADVVDPVLFLASDAARYITGHLLPIDGGASNIIRLTDDAVLK